MSVESPTRSVSAPFHGSPSGSAEGRSCKPTATARVMSDAKIPSTPTQVIQLMRSRVWMDATRPTIMAEMKTKAAVQMACSESALKAVEAPKRPAAAMNTR